MWLRNLFHPLKYCLLVVVMGETFEVDTNVILRAAWLFHIMLSV